MKLRNLFFASLAMVTFAACSNDDEPAIENNEPVDAGVVNINITPENLTKSAPATKADEKGDEATVNSFTVYVYEGNAYLTKAVVNGNGSALTPTNEKYGPATISSGLKTNTNYTFVAVANGPTITEGTALSALEKISINFNTESFIMSGKVQQTVGGQTTEITIPVSRRLAAVQVESVAIDFTDLPAENFKSATAKLTHIYLVNVRNSSLLGSDAASGVTIENTGAKYMYGSDFDIKAEDAKATEQNDFWGTENTDLRVNPNLTFPINDAKKLGQAVRLYAAPTTSANTDKESHPIMLKLRVEYTAAQGHTFEDGKTTAIRYYTIYLKQEGTDGTTYGVKNNTLYKVTATLKGLGSKTDNEIEETAGDVEVFIRVLPWEVREQVEPDIKD